MNKDKSQIVKDFLKSENDELNNPNKLTIFYPEYYFYEDFKDKKFEFNLNETRIIKTSILKKILPTLFLLYALFFWFVFLLTMLTTDGFPITHLFFILISVFVSFLIWTFYLDPKLNYRININSDYFHTKKVQIPFSNIIDALIKNNKTSKKKQYTLVIFTKNKSYNFIIDNLNISGEELLALINFYKNKAQLNQFDKQERNPTST